MFLRVVKNLCNVFFFVGREITGTCFQICESKLKWYDSFFHSFVCLFVHWFIRSLIHWLIDWFIHSFIHSCSCWCSIQWVRLSGSQGYCSRVLSHYNPLEGRWSTGHCAGGGEHVAAITKMTIRGWNTRRKLDSVYQNMNEPIYNWQVHV